jgi:hypothetical protein
VTSHQIGGSELARVCDGRGMEAYGEAAELPRIWDERGREMEADGERPAAADRLLPKQADEWGPAT